MSCSFRNVSSDSLKYWSHFACGDVSNNDFVSAGEQGDCFGSEVCAADVQERNEEWVTFYTFVQKNTLLPF